MERHIGGIKLSLVGLVILLTLPHSTQAHNGAVAIAVPVEGITVDGDLSDWPEGMREYPIALVGDGPGPEGDDDFAAHFRTGYDSGENALYVGIEVQDDDIALDHPTGYLRDGCNIFLDLEHVEGDTLQVVQGCMWGNEPAVFQNGERAGLAARSFVEASVRRGAQIHEYEWRFFLADLAKAMGLPPGHGMSVGFAIDVNDLDEDGATSRMAWGRGRPKYRNMDAMNRGDLVLADGDKSLGKIQGSVEWEDQEEGIALGKVRIQSVDSQLWVQVKTDSKGEYEVELPADTYQVRAGYRREETEPVEVALIDGFIEHVDEMSFGRPPLGRTIEAGQGLVRAAGSGRGLWRTYDVPDGLAGSFVNEIFQDNMGALWFGSDGDGVEPSGISRYDGVAWTTYTTKDGLAHNWIGSIFQSRNGNIWFGTYGGISCYDGQSWTTYTTEDGLAHNGVGAIFQARDGNLWFGTDGGVSRYDGETWTTYTTADGLAHNAVRAILQDRDDDLWFGTDGGVSRYNDETWTTYTTTDGLAHSAVTAIRQGRDDDLWFSTYGGGVSRYDGETWTTYTTEDGLLYNHVFSILLDRDGHLWATYDASAGVSRYDGQAWTTYTTEDGLSSNQVKSIFQDREGNFWFGTYGGGVSFYDQSFVTFTRENGLADNFVLPIFQDSAGRIWAGTNYLGLSRYDGKTWTTFTKEDGLASNEVRSFFEDREGDIWVGSNQELSRYDGQTWTIFGPEDGVSRFTYSIMQDGDGSLLFGTERGVSRYDGQRITAFHGLSSFVPAMVKDRNGDLWFSTYGEGVSRYDGETWMTYTTQDGLAQNAVAAMLQDRDDDLWFSTYEGVSRYDGETWTTYTTEDGLAHSFVKFIFQDRDGNLWFGTEGGASCYDGQIWNTWTTRDGLAGNIVSSILQDSDGNLWFGTSRGITQYRPPQPVPPPIAIKAIVADQRYTEVSHLAISSNVSLIAFEFEGYSFKTHPGQIIYRYRLVGYESDWQTTRKNRVEYPGLSAGSYRFEVQAVDRDLVYSEKAAIVTLTVHPPYGVYALSGGLAFAVIGLCIVAVVAVQRRRERDQAREQLVQELEEELQTAHDMQMGLMPKGSPKIQGFDISGRCLPANHVGGDFFQYFPISDNRLAISLADVTGHAMEAAVPVMMFSGVLESEIKHDQSLDKLFASLNETLNSKLDSRTYVCFTMGEVDPGSRKFRVSNGGCPYPYHYQAANGGVSELQIDAYPLGIRSDTQYPVEEIQLERGDRVVLCSDGIIEAENVDGELFGFERTAETIKNGCSQDLSAHQFLDYLISEVKSFSGDAPQGDDQTVVVLAVEA